MKRTVAVPAPSMHWRLTLTLALAAPAWFPSASRAWGPEGHQIVAEIAERRLTPQARAQIAALLGSGVSLADVANYADSYRTRCRNTGPWHYVNIPLGAPSYDAARDCAAARGDCILSVLDRELRILEDHGQSSDERAFALRFIVHLVGDLHQPLHSTDNGDRGGNERKLRFRGTDSNLHKLWDLELIRATRRSHDAYLRHVLGLQLPEQRRALQPQTILDWALEARLVARRFVYGKLPRVTAGALELGEDYARSVMGALDLQLLRAGLRLAQLLNRAFATPGPQVSPELIAQNRRCDP